MSDSTPHQAKLFDPEPALAPWEQAAEADRHIADVVLNRPLETIYHYLVPNELRELIRPGQRVKVPFGRGDRLTVGYCVGVGTNVSTSRKLKSIAELVDREPLLSAEMLDLTRWIAERYLCTWGQVLETVVPAGVKKQAGTRMITMYQPAGDVCSRLDALKLPAKQLAVLHVLCKADGPLPVDEITLAANCGTSPLEGLRKKGLIEPIRMRSTVSADDGGPAVRESDLSLNSDQQQVLDRILDCIRGTAGGQWAVGSGQWASEMQLSTLNSPLSTPTHETFLLHGVTGSGKTEIYIRAIQEVVSYGREAIVLVPEISLTPQTIRRFRSRFDSVAVLHSHLSDAERHWHWQRIANGEVKVVVGARSAVFAPTPHLGIIVIDEEHEASFKQGSTPRYHAREVARERARRERIPLILGTATPTLESLLRTERGEDVMLSLPGRVNNRPMPPVVTVDVRNDPQIGRGHAIGRALQHGIQRALADDGQVILFLNLRGFSPVLWCWKCGGGVKCPNCDITLTWHKDRGRIVCHSCEYESPPPERCPHCEQPGLRYFGTGTQKLEQEVIAKFPGHTVVRMDSDSMRKPGSHDKALEAFRKGEVSILLGTQMIAKGLDFPNVTLVGVVDADTQLHQPDYRAAERTFQLIAQVAGRTGRGEKGGRVLVQTTSPDEPAIQFAASHDYNGFASRELAHRREAGYPPYTTLARVILRGESYEEVHETAKVMSKLLRTSKAAESHPNIRILGPAPAPIARLRGQHRFHLQIAAPDVQTIASLWSETLRTFEPQADVEFTVDIDPLDMR
ncbi:MAG: primosomal protein N' [Planctomycetaceae bacterium]|nr:primosomal protein N' [Planctomycetaceae bacterium]